MDSSLHSPLIPSTDIFTSSNFEYLPSPIPVSLSLENVSYTVPQPRSLFQRCKGEEEKNIEILTDVSCYVKPTAMGT